jgi:hypothetical protein
MRVPLRDGQWAELYERISHGEDKEIRRASRRAVANPLESAGAGDTVALRVFIKAWNVLDKDGTAIALTDADAIDRLPEDLADELLLHIQPLYKATTVPNPPTPESSGVRSSDTSSPTEK